MPVVTSVVQDRIRILRNEINQLKPGDKIGIDHLKARLAALLKDDKGLTASAVSYALGMVRKQIDQQSNGLSLIVGRNHVRIERKIATIFDQNMQEFFEEKRAIGNVLWSWLFDFALDPGLEVRESWSGNSRLTSKLALKRSNLRQKISVAIAVDAGSTNCIAVREFLAGTPSMPFIIRNAGPSHEGDASSQGRLISPVFITNSITIADDLGQSQHRHGLTIRVIGGTDRPDRKSICGELSLLWLRACQSEGKMISMDLSIIGTTGLSDKFRDGIVFGCDIAEE